MRKRTLNSLFDNIFWYAVYLLPIICYVICLAQGGFVSSFGAMMANFGFNISNSNPVYIALDGVFGPTSAFPLFLSSDMLCFGTYFICCWALHLIVDILLFLVRMAHNWLSCFGGEK